MVKEYICSYKDFRGDTYKMECLARDPRHAITTFNELIGKGRLVSVMPKQDW